MARLKRRAWRLALPAYVFTEHGVAMLILCLEQRLRRTAEHPEGNATMLLAAIYRETSARSSKWLSEHGTLRARLGNALILPSGAALIRRLR